ncbi:hypothetical protein I6A60_13720 [Frankia sp. AgB1.9]|uniref:hypothetical protein n=1 Tax=unclassified Frankia TaxID=2632575 RepID=UPI0019341937|nr:MULTISPECIES: hypothetical protein [unclassified Frankia]MBL7487605.1 hypothetical protein [Frankia sp. AgW1.1]MBL7548929.1 hypothetical protein [Frankia sp. AgB1.9]MBL7624897.1 hypothetical protein [Frankia sp. AgB1.8]
MFVSRGELLRRRLAVGQKGVAATPGQYSGRSGLTIIAREDIRHGPLRGLD